MKRNKQSQSSINEFMGGYSNFRGLGGLGGSLFGNNSIGGSILTGASGNNTIGSSILTGASGNIPGMPFGNIPGSNFGNNTANNSIIGAASGGLFGGTISKIKHFNGDRKNVRLFENCVQDSGFLGGWFDSVTPQKSKTVRLKLGKKGQTTDNTLSAVYVPDGYDVILHEFPRSSPKFDSGKHRILRKSSSCLSSKGLNDIISEIDIVPQAGGLSGVFEYTKSWGSRVADNPVQTVGSYGGTRVKPGTNRPFANDTLVVKGPRDNSTVVGQIPVIPGKPAYYPNKPNVDDALITEKENPNDNSQTYSAPSSSGTSWKPPSEPGNTKPNPKPPTTSYSQPTKFTNDEIGTIMGAAPRGLKEESMLKNPIVWVGIAVVVMGLIYVMMPDDKKSVTSVVSATPTPSPVKKMARKGMKVRSGRKMSGRKMKRSGRIKK